MADTKIVGGKIVRESSGKHGHDHGECDCHADHVTIGGKGTKKHPFKAIGLPNAATFAGLQTQTVFVRTGGSDSEGDGKSPQTAFATLQHAVGTVPNIIPPGVSIIFDITGIDELLPSNYILPVWKAPVDFGFGIAGADPFFRITGTAISIQATPQLVSAIPPADAVINASDVLSATQDPITGWFTLTLVTPRPSWGTSSPGIVGSGLKGKFSVYAPPYTATETHPSVAENTPSTITITTTNAPVYPIQLMEPSAHLHAAGSFNTFATITAINNDSIAFNGLKITSDDGNGGLFVGGMGAVNVQLCELDSPFIESINDYQAKILTNWMYNFPSFQSNATECNSVIFDNTSSGPFFIFGPPLGQPSFNFCLFDNADPIAYGVTVPFHGVQPASTGMLAVAGCLIRGSTGSGISWHGGSGFIQDCDIYGCAGSAIEADMGIGVLQVNDCGSSGGANGSPGTAGIFVDDGAYVKVDALTVAGGTAATPIQGGAPGQDMQVGATAAFRTWAGFATGSDGRPALNEFDITLAASTGATGSGSRLYE